MTGGVAYSNEEEGPLLPTVVDVMADLVGKAPEAGYDSSGSACSLTGSETDPMGGHQLITVPVTIEPPPPEMRDVAVPPSPSPPPLQGQGDHHRHHIHHHHSHSPHSSQSMSPSVAGAGAAATKPGVVTSRASSSETCQQQQPKSHNKPETKDAGCQQVRSILYLRLLLGPQVDKVALPSAPSSAHTHLFPSSRSSALTETLSFLLFVYENCFALVFVSASFNFERILQLFQ